MTTTSEKIKVLVLIPEDEERREKLKEIADNITENNASGIYIIYEGDFATDKELADYIQAEKIKLVIYEKTKKHLYYKSWNPFIYVSDEWLFDNQRLIKGITLCVYTLDNCLPFDIEYALKWYLDTLVNVCNYLNFNPKIYVKNQPINDETLQFIKNHTNNKVEFLKDKCYNPKCDNPKCDNLILDLSKSIDERYLNLQCV